MLCVRTLQAALVYVNTPMIQDVLADEMWAARLAAEDKRDLTPLFLGARRPYGEVRLDMGRRSVPNPAAFISSRTPDAFSVATMTSATVAVIVWSFRAVLSSLDFHDGACGPLFALAGGQCGYRPAGVRPACQPAP